MAQKNRAQMLIDITSNIFNNVINYITGQNAQDRFVNLLDSSPNIISDKDQANGYVGLDGNGAMFSSYYNENISRADLQTLLTNNLAVGYKFYQINDAVGASKIILVCADSNITLYQFGIDANTGEIGTYDIVTDSFNPIVSTGNANIVYITNAALITLGSTSGISTTTFYVVTDAVAGQLLTKGKTSITIDDGVLNLDTGESGTYVLATDTFTVATPNLQQVLDAGAVSTTSFRIDDTVGNYVQVDPGVITIINPLGGIATITIPTLDESVTFELPDKPVGTQTFAMLSDLTSGGITKATAAGTDTYTTTITGVTGYADGDTYLIRFTNGNTTAATLNINDGTSFLGAKSLFRNNDGALIGGDIWDGGEMLCIFNSFLNGFQCIGTSPNSLFAYVTNAESVSITKGQAVYVFGGQGDRITVKLASNQSDTTSAQTIGIVVTSSIAANQRGIIIVQGQLDGLSLFPTSTWADGDFVYLGATAGTVTKTKPYAPNHLVYLGYVVKASAGSAGRMYVKVQNGYELDELHDVSAQTVSNKDGLFYNSTTGLWTARQVAATDIDANVSNTEFGYLDGVTSNIQTQINTASTLSIECISGTITSPVDATTYFWCIGGTFLTAATVSTGQGSRFAYNFELIGITIRMTTTTAGTNEDSTLYLRNITAGTSTLMGTFKTNGNIAYTSITGLTISCNTTDEYCLEARTPTWATNPVNLRLTASLFLRRT
jgi:hypothetical protein